MAWTLIHNPSLGIIELTFSGLTSGGDLTTATAECSDLGDATNTARILADMSKVELAISLLDIMNLARQFSSLDINRLTRIALLQPRCENAAGLIRFFETVCVNRGWFVRIFTSRHEALAWLGSIPAAGPDRPETFA